MQFEVGERVMAETESTDRPPRTGVVEEVLGPPAHPRYRIKWEDGHETILTPAAGSLGRAAERAGSTR